jgi:hypothetical protein
MRRRTVLTTGLAGILGVAGCVDQSQSSDDTDDSASEPDSDSNDNTDDSTNDNGASASVEILDHEFRLNSGSIPEDEQLDGDEGGLGAAPAIIDEKRSDTGGEVTIAGIVTGRNGCMEGQLLSAPMVDGETITASVGATVSDEVAKRREEGERIVCTDVIVQDRYELTIEYSGPLNHFEITQSGMESAGKANELRPSWLE